MVEVAFVGDVLMHLPHSVMAALLPQVVEGDHFVAVLPGSHLRQETPLSPELADPRLEHGHLQGTPVFEHLAEPHGRHQLFHQVVGGHHLLMFRRTLFHHLLVVLHHGLFALPARTPRLPLAPFALFLLREEVSYHEGGLEVHLAHEREVVLESEHAT